MCTFINQLTNLAFVQIRGWVLGKHSGSTANDKMSPAVSNKVNQERDDVDSLVKDFVFCCAKVISQLQGLHLREMIVW